MASDPVVLRVDAAAAPDLVAAVAHRVVTELAGGGAVVLPTDTVYGVGAHPDRPGAVERLFELKGRAHTKPFAVLAADVGQARTVLDVTSLSGDVRGAVEVMMRQWWPGALTLVGPRDERWAHIDLGGDPSTIGVRVPDSAVVRAVCATIGPVVVTSANLSGQPTPTVALDAARSLGDRVSLVVDAGPCSGAASTVLDVTSVPFRVLRRGELDPLASGLDAALFESNQTLGSGAPNA